MKRYRYVVAATCLLLSAMGFFGIYATNQTKEKEQTEQVAQDSQAKDTEKQDSVLSTEKDQVASKDEESNLADNSEDVSQPQIDGDKLASQDTDQSETPVSNTKPETLHFSPENGLVWPIEGNVLLDYSMEQTIFFPTLQQYQYNPAMVLSGKVNEKVYFVAKGKVTNISTNEVTGCTVTQDLGDGYTAVYGQLKELNFEVGDMVESGQVVGYISEPTKYFSVEGSNVYFQILKDGKPVDPEEILP